MNFVFLIGDRTRALKLANRIAKGKLHPVEQVRLLGYTIDAKSLDTLIEVVAREDRRRRLWPFIAQSDDDEMLLRLAW